MYARETLADCVAFAPADPAVDREPGPPGVAAGIAFGLFPRNAEATGLRDRTGNAAAAAFSSASLRPPWEFGLGSRTGLPAGVTCRVYGKHASALGCMYER